MRGLKYISMDGGYGEAAHRAIAALDAAGVPVTWTPMVQGPAWGRHLEPATRRDFGPEGLRHLCNRPLDYDVVLVHAIPDYFPGWARAEPGKRLIGQTVWETDQLPVEWRPWLRAVGQLVVPCEWNADVLARELGGARPTVIPHACMDDAGPEPFAAETDEFCFYTIGMWTRRKGITSTIEAFLRAFRREDRVRLIVKTTPRAWVRRRWWANAPGRWGRLLRKLAHGGWPSSRRELAELTRRFPAAPPVELITENLSAQKLRQLHRRGHAYVSLCCSEGWGLGAFDAACCDRPVIMTGYGGQRDYLDPARAWLVDYDLVACDEDQPELGWSYRPPQRWARPRLEHAVEMMRAVRREPAAAHERAAELGADLRDRFAPGRIARALLACAAAAPVGISGSEVAMRGAELR